MKIDWQSEEFHFYKNPRTPFPISVNLEQAIGEFHLHSHILIATSGSTACNPKEIKYVALKKSAILASSYAVNEHLMCTHNDVILNSLPHFHIGGLSTYARAYLSKAKLVDIYSEGLKWNPSYFVKEAELNKTTITSLVPTQIFDIVSANLKSPKKLRAVIVGGSALSRSLYLRAIKLGWPLLPSYGMTECGSQIATAPLDFKWNTPFPSLNILNHLKVKINLEGKICIAGDSLLTGYLFISDEKYQFKDVKSNFIEDPSDIYKYIITSDLGSVHGSTLNIFGRNDDVVKIGGESVSLTRLDEILLEIKSQLNIKDDFVVVAECDERLQHKISLVLLEENKGKESLNHKVISEFNKKAFPFEKIKNICYVKSIPRTELGKLKRSQLLNDIM